MKCSCGCNKDIIITRLIKWKLGKGQKSFYIKGHYHPKGIKSPTWKGGTHIKDGYKIIHRPEHENSNCHGYIREQRFIMSKFLNRPLFPSEIVHHKDGNKTNNNINNLTIVTRSNHISKYHPFKPKDKTPKICPNCGQSFIHKDNYRRDKCCSIKCRGEYHKGLLANNLKINQKIADEIRLNIENLPHRKLAIKYNLSKTHIGRILRREIWS